MQCVLKAALAGQERPEPFHETPEEHLARVHGDAEQCAKEAAEIRAKLDERQALAKAARFN
jgi:hypothetical protein